MAPIRVLYIAGCGRSGSTLLDSVLGQLDSSISCGELWHVWRRGLVENRLCGDGQAFRAHPFWNQVFASAFGGMAQADAALAAILQGERRLLDVRTQYPRLAAGQAPRLLPGSEAYVEALGRLYRAIAEVSGCRTLVDSSKYPVYAWLLSQLPGVEVVVLQLVRDPRGVVHSWSQRKPQPDKQGHTDRHGLAWSLLQWRMANAAAQSLPSVAGLSHQLLRYEDFIAAPQAAVAAIATWLGQDQAPALPLAGEAELLLPPSRAFSGSAGRFQRGRVHLRLDQAWRREMPAWKRRCVEWGAGPQFRVHGYASMPDRASPRAAPLPERS
ncbi:MAG TPA: sulfotransferase [Solimonas sp.]|nr:sulfotransferase [Solimonas sp.]